MKTWYILLLLFPALCSSAEGDIPIVQSDGTIQTRTVSGDATITASGIVSIPDPACAEIADSTAAGCALVSAANAAEQRTTIGVDPAGTDNSTPVTVVDTATLDLSVDGQAISGTVMERDPVFAAETSLAELESRIGADLVTAGELPTDTTDRSEWIEIPLTALGAPPEAGALIPADIPYAATLTGVHLACDTAPTVTSLIVDLRRATAPGATSATVLTADINLPAGSVEVDAAGIATDGWSQWDRAYCVAETLDTGGTAADCICTLSLMRTAP